MTVVSPYVKAHFARELVALQQRGVEVSLATSEAIAKRRDVACELVEQLRHTDEGAGRRRKKGMLLCALWGLSCVPVSALAPSFPLAILYALLSGPLAFVLLLCHHAVRVHSYSYCFRLGRVRILVSPYADVGDPDKQPLMTHAKVYVIDDEVAYLGSLNLTTEGFFDNFESCVRIDDSTAVREIIEKVQTLFADNRWRTLEAHDLGRALYDEPTH